MKFFMWKIINSTNQQRFELVYKKFQTFASGKFAIQQFNGEWCMLDFPLSVLLQVLKSFCHSIFGNSTNQQRLELLLEIFQVFASGKLPI